MGFKGTFLGFFFFFKVVRFDFSLLDFHHKLLTTYLNTGGHTVIVHLYFTILITG